MRGIELMVAIVTVVGLAGTLGADGRGLAQLRETLAVPGEVLIQHEDAATIASVLAEGSRQEVVSVGADEGVPFANAMRLHVARAYEQAYQVQFMSERGRGEVRKGDVLLMSCWLRAPEAAGEHSGVAAIYLQTAGSEWRSPANATGTYGVEWRQVFAVGVADRDYPAAGLQVAMHVGQQRQTLDVGGIVVLNLGPGVDVALLPRTRVTWPGMDADAPWRAAQRRIEQHRMAELTVVVRDAAGRPLADAPVSVTQQRRAFTIGSFTNYRIAAESDDARQMREVFHRLFNRATAPIYWADWGWPGRKDNYLDIARWTAANGFVTRGHVMIYPAFHFMPADAVRLKDQPEKLRERLLQQVREISEAMRPFGFCEYDVTNELRDCVDLHRLLGREVVIDWFAEARRQLPEAKLTLNENTILTRGGATQANQDLFLEWYRLLKSAGHAPDVMGFQGHFGEDFTAPETVYAILERFARETDAELQITEFDINTLDEEAQAAYIRDFLTICFSHPRITGFTMWGIWEGDHWLPRAALYRTDWTPKPNALALEELLTKTWWTRETVNTDERGTARIRAFLGSHEVSVEIGGQEVRQNIDLETPAAKTVELQP